MKKLAATAMAAVMMTSSAFAGEISVNLDGELVEFAGQEPVIVEGRTLIPLRGVFEQLGYDISWDNSTKTAQFKKGDTDVKVTADAKEFNVNGESVELDVPAQIINGSMMLPLRAVGEATGLEVNWDGDTKTVDLKTLNYSVNEVLGDDVEFNYDPETGWVSVKPKEETVTEDTTEAVTEAQAETESHSQVVFTDEEKKNGEDFVEYMKALYLCEYYLSVAGDYSEEMNGYNTRKAEDRVKIKECLKEVIAVTDAVNERSNEFKANNTSGPLLNDLRTFIKSADKFYNTLLERYEADVENIYNDEVNNSVGNYNSAFQKFYDNMQSKTSEYLESTSDWYWNINDMSDEERTAVNEYQKKVGEILERNLSGNSDFRTAKDNYSADKLVSAADAIKNEVSVLDTPEICKTDAQILILATDLLKESAEARSEQTNEYDYVYPTALIMAFDTCAENCAGNYYNSLLMR